ncbi:YdeI/OmpD-associated family protein [Sphingomonas humi]|uniref:YdeI/OmpD-associated family protein n=1 Tax=Sphingomonas humi TaxID=335630 RepID=A0ABP7RSS1_9SPHN
MGSLQTLAGGVVHALPDDLRDALLNAPAARATWDDITPIARNEWICWVTSPKNAETRIKRVAWGIESLSEGKRRPCCWPGCPHRERGN